MTKKTSKGSNLLMYRRLLQKQRIERLLCAEQVVNHAEQFTDTMSLCAAMSLSLRTLQTVVILKNRIEPDDRQDDLVQGLAQVFGAFLGNRHMLSLELTGLMLIRSKSGKFYDFCSRDSVK